MAPTSAGQTGDILVTLAGINRGRAADEASRRLADVVQAVTQNGGKGSVTIKVEVKQFAGGDGTVEVAAKIASTAPQAPHAGVFFFDQKFNLTRDDPSMEPMFGRDELSESGGDR